MLTKLWRIRVKIRQSLTRQVVQGHVLSRLIIMMLWTQVTLTWGEGGGGSILKIREKSFRGVKSSRDILAHFRVISQVLTVVPSEIQTWDLSICLYLIWKHGHFDHSATLAGFLFVFETNNFFQNISSPKKLKFVLFFSEIMEVLMMP